MFEEAARLLRPGGALVAIEPGSGTPSAPAWRSPTAPASGCWTHGTPDDVPLSPRALTRRRGGCRARTRSCTRSPTAGAACRAAPQRALHGLDRLGSRRRARAARPHPDADRAPLAMASRYDDELWELVPAEPGPAAGSPGGLRARARSRGTRARPGLRRRAPRRRARRRAADGGRRVARGPRARAGAARRARASWSWSPTRRCRSRTEPSTWCWRPRRPSTFATCSCSSRRSGACSCPAASWR